VASFNHEGLADEFGFAHRSVLLERGKEVMLPSQPARSDTLVVTIGGPISPGQVDGMCAGLLDALDACDPERIVCDVARLRPPDATTIDLLARLALIARRQHRHLALAGASTELTDLLSFAGIGKVPGLGLEPERQAERGEDALDVEEEGDPGDSVA
jgi:MFS superfamily sulfate permease-like transporter